MENTIDTGEQRTLVILSTLLRFGPLPAWALFWHAIEARDYETVSERKDFEAKLRKLEDRQLIVRTLAAPTKKLCFGFPGKTKLVRLAKAGAELLAQHGVTDILGQSPAGLRASDFHTPASWRHDALAAGTLARLAENGYEFVTDLELQRVCKSLGTKLPDALIRKAGSDEAWTLIEVEHSKKTGGWAQRQARSMALAMTEGFTLADRWHIEGAWLITTTNPESPTAEEFAQRMRPFLTVPVTLQAVLCDVDETGKPETFEMHQVEIVPAAEQDITIEYTPYGKHYVQALHAIHERWSPARYQEAESAKEQVQVGLWSCGDFSGSIYIDRPLGGDYTAHWTSLDFRGQRVTQDIELGNAETIDNLPALLSIAMRWGDTQCEYRAEELIAEMVFNDRSHLIRRLPELHRWLRADGRSVEQIAEDWKTQQQHFADEEAARMARIRKMRGE